MMSRSTHGEEVFRNRWEYPLQTNKTGTRDYIFDFVPSPDDEYGEGARSFFTRYYKNHHRHQVASLQALIAVLRNEVQGGVTHIRELVIVAHGTAQALLVNVVNGVTDTQHKKYKYVMASSLLALQQELETDFPTLRANRAQVIPRLTNESWVTVRACNFGQSGAGLYALYAFFGGRANVYCPKVYQFFGQTPIGPRARFASRLDAHQHLVKQRFIPKDIHTPQRQDAVVQYLTDPSGFMAPKEITSVGMPGIIAELDERRLSDTLKSHLAQQGITLSPSKLSQAKPVIVQERGIRWKIVDVFEHPAETPNATNKLGIEYLLSILPSPTQLRVDARPLTNSTQDSIPLQLLLNEFANQDWHGRLFDLAGYAETTLPYPGQARFDDVEAGLSQVGATAVAVPQVVVGAFADPGGITLSPSATVKQVPPGPPQGPGRKDWLLDDHGEGEYLIKLLHIPTRDGTRAHALVAFEHFSKKRDAVNRRVEKLVYLLENPDHPGVELVSYLDTLPIDDLTALIDHLNAPYRVEHAYYLHHAVQAIARKHDFGPWLATRPGFPVDPNAGPLDHLKDPYTNLSLSQWDDLEASAYKINTSSFWAEVKASRPAPPAFQSDLFTEHPFAFEPGDLFALDHIEPDSPGADLRALRALDRTELDLDLQVEKTVFEPPPEEPEDVSCATFRNLVQVMKTLAGKTPDEIEVKLNDPALLGGPTMSLTKLAWWGMPQIIDIPMDLWDTMGNDPGGVLEDILGWANKKYPVSAPGRKLFRRLTFRSWNRSGLLIHAARAVPYKTVIVDIVVEIFRNYLAEYGNALKKWEHAGRIVAVRQWCERLWSLSIQLENSFPTEVEIDLGTDLQKLYNDEIGWPVRQSFNVIMDMDRFRVGFEEGVRIVTAAANETLYRSHRILDDWLQSVGLQPCQIRTLWVEGIIDPYRSRAVVMRLFAESTLNHLPDL